MDRIDETESLRLHQSGPATTSAWKTSPVESEDRTHIFHTNLAGVVAFAVCESCILVLVERYKCRTMLPRVRPFTSSPHLCCLLFHLPTISVPIFIARRIFPTILQWHPALGFSMRSHGCHIPTTLSSTCTRKPFPHPWSRLCTFLIFSPSDSRLLNTHRDRQAVFPS